MRHPAEPEWSGQPADCENQARDVRKARQRRNSWRSLGNKRSGRAGITEGVPDVITMLDDTLNVEIRRPEMPDSPA